MQQMQILKYCEPDVNDMWLAPNAHLHDPCGTRQCLVRFVAVAINSVHKAGGTVV